MDAAALRAELPVLESSAFLNAGTCGPLPRAAADAHAQVVARVLAEGRARDYYERFFEVRERLRGAYAAAIGAEPADVSVTTSTSEGIARVLTGLRLQPGDEVLIAADEHPGLLGPLAAARDRLGLRVREVPLARIVEQVGPATRLVACSQVGWTTGEAMPALDGLDPDLPVLIDGAQGAGAVATDVALLGCSFYAASGQKWLCGPVGCGLLWVSPAWRERLRPAAPTYVNLAEPARGLDAQPWPDARAHDAIAMSLETAAGALAAVALLAEFGWEPLQHRALALADELAARLADAGCDVAPRGRATLVSWRSPDPDAEVERLAAAGVVVRSFPGRPLVRASVGAWNDRSDLERLLYALGGG